MRHIRFSLDGFFYPFLSHLGNEVIWFVMKDFYLYGVFSQCGIATFTSVKNLNTYAATGEFILK